MNSYIAKTSSIIILLIGVGFGLSIQGLIVNQNQSVSQMIQPGWAFEYDTYTNTTTYHRTYNAMRNTSNNAFLGLIDVWSTTYEIYDVLEQNSVTNVASDSIGLSTSTNGTYGTGSIGASEYISVDFDNNKNITERYDDNQPIKYYPTTNSYTQTYNINNTFFPLPTHYFPKPFKIDTTIISLPLPVSWGIGNATNSPVNVTIQHSTYRATINSQDLTIDAVDVKIQETIHQWNEVSSYVHSSLAVEIYYELSMSYDVEIVLTYDRSNGMLLKSYYDVSLKIDYESTYTTEFSKANPQALNSRTGVQLNQNNDWIVKVTDNYYYYFEVMNSATLKSMTHLYQKETSSTTTSTTSTSTSDTSTTSTSSSTTSTTNTTSTEPTGNSTTTLNETDGTSTTQTPELNLPGLTFFPLVSAGIILGLVVRKARNR